MGDRANVVIPQEGMADVKIYLYTHWGGSELPAVVQRALARRERWADRPYLTRIIFDAMTEGRHGSETGAGISAYLCDNEYPLLIVDTNKQEVCFQPVGQDDMPCGKPLRYSFEEYVKLPDVGWPETDGGVDE